MTSLTFEVDQAMVQAGGVLSGHFCMKTTKAIETTGIVLFFTGKEFTAIGSHHKHDPVHKQKLRLVNLDLGLNKEELILHGRTKPGSYKIPFQVTLPKDLPSSMDALDNPAHAKIVYNLRAKLKDSGYFSDYEAREPIQVLAHPMLDETVPKLIQPMVQSVMRLQLKGSGDLYIGAKVSDTKLVPGQQVGVILSIVNDSRIVIREVRLSLQQVVKVQAEREDFGTKVIKNAEITNTIVSKDFVMENTGTHKALDRKAYKELCEKLDRIVMENTGTHKALDGKAYVELCEKVERIGQNFRYPQCQATIMQELNNKKESEAMVLPIPLETTESYEGKLIQVSYKLMGRIKTEKWATNPEFCLAAVTLIPRGSSPSTTPVVPVAEAVVPVAEAVVPVAEAVPIIDQESSDKGAKVELEAVQCE